MLSAIFICGGVDALKEPEPKAKISEDVAVPIARHVVGLPEQPEKLVRINDAVQVCGGFLLAAGLLPRAAAFALAGSLVPTTLAGHRFWELTDPDDKQTQKIQFLKNVGLLGGLLLAATGRDADLVRMRPSSRIGDRG